MNKEWIKTLDQNTGDRHQYELKSAGFIANGFEIDDAKQIRACYHINGSGGSSFGGAKYWPHVSLNVSFQTGEETKRDDFTKALQAFVKGYFA